MKQLKIVFSNNNTTATTIFTIALSFTLVIGRDWCPS